MKSDIASKQSRNSFNSSNEVSRLKRFKKQPSQISQGSMKESLKDQESVRSKESNAESIKSLRQSPNKSHLQYDEDAPDMFPKVDLYGNLPKITSNKFLINNTNNVSYKDEDKTIKQTQRLSQLIEKYEDTENKPPSYDEIVPFYDSGISQ